MRLISGIPPWVSMYYEKLKAKTGKKAGDLFPNFGGFAEGGPPCSAIGNVWVGFLGGVVMWLRNSASQMRFAVGLF